jgi:hypothetical protein
MKTHRLVSVLLLVFLLSGCMVYSFYPLYTEKDLFPNELLTGEWFESDQTNVKSTKDGSDWKFEHPYPKDKENTHLDSCMYVLKVTEKEEGESVTSTFLVHVIKLEGNYFLDFYLKDYPEDGNIRFSTFHVIPVHTFAKLTVSENSLKISWFDPDWLEKLIKENKIRIHHEENDDVILLTAKSQELQKFVSKYVNSEDAFDNGITIVLQRK